MSPYAWLDLERLIDWQEPNARGHDAIRVPRQRRMVQEQTNHLILEQDRPLPDYKGKEGDAEAAQQYFANRFRAINRTAGREIYVHFTNATDTTLLKATMQSVQDMIVQKNLQNLIL